MSTLGLLLDDAGLAIARDGELQSIVPSIVDAGREDPARAGQPAASRARSAPQAVASRHWFDLATGQPPVSGSLRLARAELGVRFEASAAPGDALQVAVPATYDAAALSHACSRCCARSTLPVAGFVDAAALSAAALAVRPAIALELGLHHVAATRVDGGVTECRRRGALVRNRAGLATLQDAWLRLIGEAMVLRTRFDPLHDAASEQQLYDLLPEIVARAAQSGSTVVSLPVGDERHEITLSRDQFATRVEPLYREILGLVHELRPAGVPVTLLADARIDALPGLREALAQFRGCELVDAAARLCRGRRVAARRRRDGRATGAPASRRRAVRARRRSPAPSAAPRSAATPRAAPAPTHVLWAGRAVPLAAAALEIGREPAPGGIALGEGLAGVSRLHCTLRREAGDVVLVDHSRYGTRVNGERVAGRTRLRAGDRLLIGDPGIEVSLIAVGVADGAPA